jgi:hypothetical protein
MNPDDPRRPLHHVKVGIFPFDGRNTRFMAYTTWYNPEWPGCCEHEVEVFERRDAKAKAIQEHKERCVKLG